MHEIGTGEPRHIRRAHADVHFKDAEPSRITVHVEHDVYTPEYGPAFEFTDAAKDKYASPGHLLDQVRRFVHERGEDTAARFEEFERQMESEGSFEVEYKGTTYHLRDEEIEREIVEIDADGFGEGLSAAFMFGVSDGEAVLDSIMNPRGIVESADTADLVSIKVLRLWPSAVERARAMPGIESVRDPRDVADELFGEGESAEWGA